MSAIKLTATPRYLTVGDGEAVTYRVESDGLPFWVDANDVAVWVVGELTGGNDDRILEFFVRGGIEHKVTFDKAGKFGVAAILQLKDGDPRLGGDLWRPSATYFQNVQPTKSFMWDPVNKERTHVQDPASAVAGVLRYLGVLKGVGAPLQFDLTPLGQAAWDKHKKVVARYEDYLAKLQGRLASTSDWIRIPLTASHRPTGSVTEAELNVFLAHQKDEGLVFHWKVVDWTHPGDKNLDGEYDGKGITNADAARAAIKAWQDGNQYPPGQVLYEVPAGVLDAGVFKSSFNTTGRSFLGKVADFLESASIFLAIVAVILTVAPIPGSQVAAAALWIGIFSGALGAAAAGLNIAERHLRGVSDLDADALDALTIAGCMLGFGGTWVRSAKLAMRVSGAAREMVLLGEVGVQSVQGVLVVSSSVAEIEQTINDKSLTPDDKIKKLLKVVGALAVQGALLYINIKGTAEDIARINTPKPPPPKKPPPSPNGEKLDGPPAENLKKLKDSKKKIDLTEDPTQTGKTTEGPHTTTVHAEPPRARTGRPTFDEKFPKDDKFWTSHVINDNEIHLQHRFREAPDNHDAELIFHATFDANGTLTVEMIQTVNWKIRATGEIISDPSRGPQLVAQGKAEVVRSAFFDGTPCLRAHELYPMMFDHFEEVAALTGRKINTVSGKYAFENYQDWRAAVSRGADRKTAILDDTISGRLWKTEFEGRGYDYKMPPGSPLEDPNADQVSYIFHLTKK